MSIETLVLNDNGFNQATTKAEAELYFTRWTREELIAHLCSIDRHGVFTDEDSVIEFGRPATHAELVQSALSIHEDDIV